LSQVTPGAVAFIEDVVEEDDPPPAFFDYIRYRRNSSGKMATKNEDIFIFWG
jgi:hypothetical protein